MLPIEAPITPMLARSVGRIPPGMAYEPKWDGWRCLLFRDGESVTLYSRRGTELTSFFPELVAGAVAMLPEQCVLDGEIVIIDGGRLDYTKLAQRHSTADRAGGLAARMPATLLAFDLLAFGQTDLMPAPQRQRRELLEQLMAEVRWPFLLTPSTDDLAAARHWFTMFEDAGLDGVIARPLGGRYLPGQRSIFKIKHVRTADVVVGGYRLDRTSRPGRPSLGSLQVGLFDQTGTFQFVGVCPGFPVAQRAELAVMLSALEVPADAGGHRDHPWDPVAADASGARVPDGADRWSGRPAEVVRLIDPVLVCEVSFDHLYEGVRFRSNASLIRWRPDRDPTSCTFDQLAIAQEGDLRAFLGS